MLFGTVIAATFEVTCPPPNEPDIGCSIFLSGKIERGDFDRLANILRSPPSSSDIFRELILNSPGGDVAEALRLSELVRKALLETRNQSFADFMDSVKKGLNRTAKTVFPCISACFLVFMSGAKRFYVAFGNGKIGLHRPFFASTVYSNLDPAAIAARQAEAMQKVADVLRREGVPPTFIDEMMRRSSKEMYWLSSDDWMQFPTTAFWYEELLIARCNFDPTVERRMVQAIEHRDSQTASELQKKLMAYAACERSAIRDAQTKMRAP